MKNILAVLAAAILVSATIFSGFATPNAKDSNVISSENHTTTQTNYLTSSFSDQLTYVRVYKDGKWWVYVYDGNELVDVYAE